MAVFDSFLARFMFVSVNGCEADEVHDRRPEAKRVMP